MDTCRALKAERDIFPSGTRIDDTNHGNSLHPGVLLCCAGSESLYTTSGIPLQKGQNSYVTVATHGFPPGREIVHHPDKNGSAIGQASIRLGGTDISLMSLYPGIAYSTDVVSSNDDPTTPKTAFRALRHPDTIKIHETVWMDNPYMGRQEGIIIGVEYLTMPEDGPGSANQWTTAMWIQTSKPKDGSCGSILYTAEGDVVGFFRFVNKYGYLLALSVELLIRLGYELSPIEEQLLTTSNQNQQLSRSQSGQTARV